MVSVLQVVPELDAGGVERTAIDIAAAIVAAGGRALTASRGGRLEDELAAVGGVLVRMPAHAKDPVRLAANAMRLARLARRESVDIIHARSRAPAWSALWAARASGRPFVTTYAGTHKASNAFKRGYNSVMARGDRVIANSRFIAGHILAEHGTDPERIVVIPRGIDTAAFDPAAVSPERIAAVRQAWGVGGPREPVVLMPGRLTRWKGQTVMIEALAALAQGGPSPAVLVLAGDDQGRTGYREELAELARARGLQSHVMLPGHCADMPAAYAAADIAVSASVEPEAFGRVAVEAQCMGRPVIATAHGGALETIEADATGVLAAPGDAGAMAAALGKVLALSSGERLAMGERGARRARRLYSVEAMQSATLAVYDEMMERARHD